MRGGIYFRLAKDGIIKNRKLYFPYILTCICMVMMFYIIYYLGISADFTNVRGGEMLQSFLALGVYIIGAFALIFLYYTNSFLIRRRKREFGLYNILGMGKSNLIRLLICENFLTAVVSLIGGSFFGILFSKLGELAAVRILGGNTGFAIHIQWQPFLVTFVWFLLIFILVMLRMIFYILRLKPVEMLKSESVGEKPPKANWVLALLGAVLLIGAYYLAVAVIDPMSAMVLFFLAVLMVIAATYLLFISGSVALCRLLQKNKRYYYKTRHFISLSSMVYRMKRNGAGLASICILSTMMLVTVSTTMCLYAQIDDSVKQRYPQDIVMGFDSSDYNETQTYKKLVSEVLAQYGEVPESEMDYHLFNTAGILEKNRITLNDNIMMQVGPGEVASVRTLYFVPLEDYNRINGTVRELADDEVLVYPYKTDYRYDNLTVDGVGTWKTELLDSEPFPAEKAEANMTGSLFIVVKDMEVLRQIENSCRLASEEKGYPLTLIEEKYGINLSCSPEKQIRLYQDLVKKFSDYAETHDGLSETGTDLPKYRMDSKEMGRQDYLAINGGLFFLGVLLGAVFLFGTVLIMYYKQISEGYEDQDRFAILMKVGMTRKEIRQSINSQVLTVFFLPLVTAGVHLAFAFPMLSKILLLMSATGKEVLILVNVCCYLAFAVFYVIMYLITSKSYYTIISAKEK